VAAGFSSVCTKSYNNQSRTTSYHAFHKDEGLALISLADVHD
jgi:hypothetical protein